ncbi:MAG TPA: hypothetical protein PKK54_00995 [bacterium]|nr:hypothetical protein [bacterium]
MIRSRNINKLNLVLLNSDKALSLFIWWTIVVFIIFGIFGSSLMIRGIIYQNNLIKELGNINQSLSTKRDSIQNEFQKIKDNEESIKILDSYLSAGYNLQDYLVDYSFISAETGLSLKSLINTSESDDSTALKVTSSHEGTGDVVSLVGKIEEMKRVSEIEKLDVRNGKDEKEVVINLKVFVLD